MTRARWRTLGTVLVGSALVATALAGAAPAAGTGMPSLYLPSPSCPGVTTPVCFAGFPADTTYTFASDHATFTPSTDHFDDHGIPKRMTIAVAADAPQSFTVSATSTDGGPPVTQTLTLAAPSMWIDHQLPDWVVSASCLHPRSDITVTTGGRAAAVHGPRATDASGAVTVHIDPVATADAGTVSFRLSDSAGSTNSADIALAGTTVAAGRSIGSLTSPHLAYRLSLQACTLVVQRIAATGDQISSAWWAPNVTSDDPRCHARVQTDGNVVIYRGSGAVWWSLGTQATGMRNRLVLQDDGNLVLYTAAGQAVWSTRHGRHRLTAGSALLTGQSPQSGATSLLMQRDGNLVLRNAGAVAWASGTHRATRLAMQTDGNLVLYRADRSVAWASRTAGTGSDDLLDLEPGAHLSVLTASGRSVWRAA